MSSRVNLFAPEVRANPYALYAELRRHNPVCQVDPGGMWAVARAEDVVAAFKNPKVFSSEGLRQTYRPEWIPNYPIADSMLVMDPPDHTRLRTLISRAFGPSVQTRLEPRIREHAKQVIAGLPAGRSVDFVEHFAFPVPIAVVGELVGITNHPKIKDWMEVITQFTSVGSDLERQAQMRATVNEIREYFEDVLEARRREPREDLVSDLMRARLDGQALTHTELMGFLMLLLLGGLETTVHLLSYSARRLQEQPELMTRLRAEPALIPRFIEEALRHGSPIQGLVRLAMEDVELGGVRIPKGGRVLLLVASANRDEALFPDPDRFDMDRPVGQHSLPFGHGIHFCLGAQLARLEARLALEALLARFSRLTPGDGPVRFNVSVIMRGALSLPLVPHED
ncbi:cytochrome P450 [Archangium sp.]|uniref:cytochrome P450 n=1 Tax=Archangium sp. TaxID=1872627 RepID=UPI002ED8BC40